MGEYFKPEYEEYLNALGSSKVAASSATELQTSVENLSNEMAGITTYILEFSGEFSEEAGTIVYDMIEEADKLKATIDEKLPGVIEAMKELGPKLNDIKDGDNNLVKYRDIYNTEKAKTYYDGGNPDVHAVEFDNYPDPKAAWTTYHNEQVKIAKDKVESIEKELEKLVVQCDDYIAKIKTFNDNLVDIQTRLATMMFVKQDVETNYDAISNMTLEEREAYFRELIDKMTERYNEYKAAYEEYTKFEEKLSDEEKVVFHAIIELLGFDEYSGFVPGVTSTVEYGMRMVALSELLSKPGKFGNQDKTVLENVMDYIMNGGQDVDDVELWKSSGLMALYINGNATAKYRPFESGDWTDEELQLMAEESQYEFWFDLSAKLGYEGVDARKHREEIVTHLKNAVDILDENAAGFDYNYQKSVQVGVAIKGLESIRVRTKYGVMAASDGFLNFGAAENEKEINTLINGVIFNNELEDQQGIAEYLTTDERKMFDYIYGTYGEDKAVEYLIEITDPVFKRQGMLEAQQWIDKIHSGSNENLDALYDYFRSGAKGLGDGFDYFVDGLVDLVDPSSVISKDEYAQLAILDMLKNDSENGDLYYDILLESYNFGYNTGQKAIPTILNLVTPYRIGDYVELASKIGNRTEDLMREKGDNQGAALLKSLVYEGSSFYTGKDDSFFKVEASLIKNLIGAATGIEDKIEVDKILYNAGVDKISGLFGTGAKKLVGMATDKLPIDRLVDDVTSVVGDNLGVGKKVEELIADQAKSKTQEVVKAAIDAVEEHGNYDYEGTSYSSEPEWVRLGVGLAREAHDATTAYAETADHMAPVIPSPTPTPISTVPTLDVSGKGNDFSNKLLKWGSGWIEKKKGKDKKEEKK